MGDSKTCTWRCWATTSSVVAVALAVMFLWWEHVPSGLARFDDVHSALQRWEPAKALLEGHHDDSTPMLRKSVGDFAEIGVALDGLAGSLNESQLARVWLSIAKPDFWRIHAELHPAHRRVKNWLKVHERFRVQIREMVESAQRAASDGDAEARKNVREQFGRIVTKLDRHSMFEDNQLFRYFEEHKKTSAVSDVRLLALANQHAEYHKIANKLDLAFKLGDTKGTELVEMIHKFEDHMLEHLRLEEQTLILPWLRLDDAAYRTYRTYLTWLFRPMY